MIALFNPAGEPLKTGLGSRLRLPKFFHWMRPACALIILLLCSACTQSAVPAPTPEQNEEQPTPPPAPEPPPAPAPNFPVDLVCDDPIEATRLERSIVSPIPDNLTGSDTTNLAATLHLPEHCPGERYPLLIHMHAFPSTRIRGTAQDDADVIRQSGATTRLIDGQVLAMQSRGYAVISYDQRGHGESNGGTRVADPRVEIQDAIAVLDFAVASTDLSLAFSDEAETDPWVGAFGNSAGATNAFLFAALDPRLDGIVSSSTWDDLLTALMPNDVFKASWIQTLSAVANNPGIVRADPLLQELLAKVSGPNVRVREDLDPDPVRREELLQFLHEHGSLHLREVEFGEDNDDFLDPSLPLRPIDALVIHGFADTLFEPNEGLARLDYLRLAEGDVKFLSMAAGHNNGSAGQPANGDMVCGSINVLLAIQQFFDAKLRGQTTDWDALPSNCITFDNNRGANNLNIGRGGSQTINIAPIEIDGQQSPRFVPLQDDLGNDFVALGGEAIFSIPTATITVEDRFPGQPEAIALIAIGIDRGGELLTVDAQVAPLRRGEHINRDMRAVSEMLEPGDRVGVLLFNTHGQFERAGGGINQSNTYRVSGSINLEILESVTLN